MLQFSLERGSWCVVWSGTSTVDARGESFIWGGVTLSSRHISSEADDLHVLAASLEVPTPPEPSARLGRAALPLILSDAVLQGARYVFIAYLGYQSLSLLGSFLMGAALGSLLGVATDFGISQQWLRLGGKVSPLTRRTFLRAIYGKVLFSLLGMAILAWLAIGGLWNIATPLAMVIGVLLMTSQSLVDSCDAVGLSYHRYATVSRFRLLLAFCGYAAPLACAFFISRGNSSQGATPALVTAAVAGVLLSCVYIWKMARALPAAGGARVGYREIWWESRWLGLNQLAIVVDVRAPLIILGFMLGETAVGLYGLVQRTTAVVELAWASISRLLVTRYSELGAGEQIREIRAQAMQAARLTGFIMAAVAICIWIASFSVTGSVTLASDTILALSLLKWGTVAIGLSSLKRPFVSGLIAIHQERAVCRVNVLSAVAGLLLVPVCIVYFDIWGPVVAWVVLEAVACALIVHLFLTVARTTQANPGPPLSQPAVL